MVLVKFKYSFSNPSYRQAAETQNLMWEENFAVHEVLNFAEALVTEDDSPNLNCPILNAIANWHKISYQEAAEKLLRVDAQVSLYSYDGTEFKGSNLLDSALDAAGRRNLVGQLGVDDYLVVVYGLDAYVMDN